MQFVNLTPHDVNFYNEDNTVFVFPKTNTVCRIDTQETEQDPILGMPVRNTKFKQVLNLPEPLEDTMYIVSMIVAQALPDRNDLIVPDTFKAAVRDDKGMIIGTRCWQTYK